MKDVKDDSMYLNIIAKLTNANKDYSTYTIQPQYGKGTYIIVKIIPGFSLAFNNFSMNENMLNIIDRYQHFSEPILKINYCLKGKMIAFDKKGKICASGKGSTAYYEGIENICKFSHFDEYESISLFGYTNQITNIFQQVFHIDKSILRDFCNQINEEDNYTVIKNDLTTIGLLNDIKDNFSNGDIDSLRIRAIELFMYELKNFKINKERKELYYSRTVVEKVEKIEKYISENLDEKLTIDYLCNEFNISLDTLKRCFKQVYSTSIYAYIKKSRLEKGKELLVSSEKSITEIALNCGYNNHHSFSKAFKDHYKITPRETRKVYVIGG